MSNPALSDHDKAVNETFGRIVTKKIRLVDMSLSVAALADSVIWQPKDKGIYIPMFVYTLCRASSGTVSVARVLLEVGSTAVVSSVAPAVAVNGVVTHTVVASVPFSNAAPLTLTTIASTGSPSTLKVDLIVIAAQLRDIYGN